MVKGRTMKAPVLAGLIVGRRMAKSSIVVLTVISAFGRWS
jgi:hypothetical protein